MSEDEEQDRGGDSPSSRDPFDRLLDPNFPDAARIREPSASEREETARQEARDRQIARQSRDAALRRRLDEEERRAKQEAKNERRSIRKRSGFAKRVLVWGTVAVAIIGFAWFQITGPNTGKSTLDEAIRPPGHPPTDESTSETPLGVPPAAPADAGAFEFLATQRVGLGPVAWDPCRPIHYVVNEAGAPPQAKALLDTAIANTSAATGLQFVDEGSTTETWAKDREAYQPDRYGERWAPALITWSTADTVPGIAGYIAGMAGGTPRSSSNGKIAYVTGQVVLDAEDITRLLTDLDGANTARAIIQHELGHLVGLDHVADPYQLMYTEGSHSQAGEWGSGDLAGLHILGTQPCRPDL